MTNRRRRECPYANTDELQEAIAAAGSVDILAQQIAASPSTVRKWCREMGASTRTGKVGAPRAGCPYASADELKAGLDELGSVAEMARHHNVAYNTALRWCRERGVPTHRDTPKSDDRLVVDRMTNAELEAILGAMGYERAAAVFGVSRSHLAAIASDRDISVRATSTPKVAMLQRRVRELETEGNAIRELIDELRYAAETVSVTPPPPLPVADRKRKRQTPVDVVLHVSDKQYGEIVHAEDTPGGRYSPEVYEDERLPRYVEAVEALLENVSYSNPIGTVWFAQGGDFVEGHGVFNGQEWHLALDAGSQVVRLSRAWAGAVARIATRAKSVGADRVAVVSVVGNHGVPQGRKGGALPPSLSFDYLCYESVRHQLAALPDNGGVDWYDPEARKAVYFETSGGIILLTHGDQDRGGGLVGAPVVTGLKNDLQVRLSTGIQHYLHLKGHYHRPTQITVGADSMTIWSGAWIGTNNLSIGRGGASAPSQNMHVLHPEHGLIATHRVKLSESVESVPLVIQ
jgi:hypothetical protein